MSTPEAPQGLKEPGRTLWDAVLDRFELEEHELLLLRRAVYVADACDELQNLVDRAGVLLAGRTHPALVELRAQRLLLARLVVALRVPIGGQQLEDGPERSQRRGLRGMYGIRGAV